MTDDETRRNTRRADGREPLLVYLDPDLIIRLKKLALDRRTHAYLLVEEAVRGLVDVASSEASQEGQGVLYSLAWDEGDLGVGRYKADIAGGALMISESRRVARLLINGVGKEEWRQKIERENILQKRSPSTARRQATLIRSRLEAVDSSLWHMVADGPMYVAMQALFAAAIEHSDLFADFLPIVRERFRVLHSDLPRRTWIDYVERCHDIDPRMPNWKISTVDKLGDAAFRMLHEVRYLTGGRLNVLRPVEIDASVIRALREARHQRALDRIQVSL